MGIEAQIRRPAGIDLRLVSFPCPAARAITDRLTDGWSPMDYNPFSQTANAQESLASRRGSTRIDFITTVLLSGKDASGTSFQEFTQTSSVNLHGCKVRTSYRILVGMLVAIECPTAGTAGKGVCVKVWDAAPGVAGHEIAIQLIKPQNLWAVPNPPPDWEIVAKSMVQGPALQTARPAVPREVRSPTPVAFQRAPANPPAVAPAPRVMVAPVRPTSVGGLMVEQRLAELDRRSTQLVESVFEILRRQAEEFTGNSLEEFRQQVEALIQDAKARMRQGLQQAYEDSAASLMDLRDDLMDQMALRGAQVIRSTEDTLRTRLKSQFAIEDRTPPVKPPAQVAKK